jgi:hypothetical protein
MGDHYSPEEIEEGLSGRLTGKRSKEVLRHLLSGCPQCQAAAQQALHRVNGPVDSSMSQVLDAAYSSMLEQAEDFARRAAILPTEERERFRQALSLLKTGDGVLALAQAGNMEVEGLGVYEALLARSWAVRYENPREMCHLAKVAVEMVHRFDSSKYGVWRARKRLSGSQPLSGIRTLLWPSLRILSPWLPRSPPFDTPARSRGFPPRYSSGVWPSLGASDHALFDVP